MKVLVTGANGFLGAALVQRLLADELVTEIVATVRSSVRDLPTGVERIVVGICFISFFVPQKYKVAVAIVAEKARIVVGIDRS